MHRIKPPALWAAYHAKSAKYALPYAAPTHAEDMYRRGEFMVWTDEVTYECLEDTDRAPDILPARWQKVDATGNPVTEPEDPPVEEPTETLNKNGTAAWSEWIAWSGNNADLYQMDDKVTYEGTRYVSTTSNNHYEPIEYGWAAVTA